MLYAVLLVEDHQPWLDRWTEDILELRDDVLVLCANTIVKAEELFEQCPGVAVIVMDACVPGDSQNTEFLVRSVRKTFKGSMIAASGDAHYRKELMAAGCDYECTKPEVPQKVIELLGDPA
ncbi:MAG: hypothetical protein UY09_C0028G0004 [Parcubacteria group bacterium GW2011_GWA2_47_8]|nr:MAG: hypothetical protein UY09_C0028G0004 [Parcubacteria group bacterium GW2011_GWA2_47_8]